MKEYLYLLYFCKVVSMQNSNCNTIVSVMLKKNPESEICARHLFYPLLWISNAYNMNIKIYLVKSQHEYFTIKREKHMNFFELITSKPSNPNFWWALAKLG